jgi:hypothetical protein
MRTQDGSVESGTSGSLFTTILVEVVSSYIYMNFIGRRLDISIPAVHNWIGVHEDGMSSEVEDSVTVVK